MVNRSIFKRQLSSQLTRYHEEQAQQCALAADREKKTVSQSQLATRRTTTATRPAVDIMGADAQGQPCPLP